MDPRIAGGILATTGGLASVLLYVVISELQDSAARREQLAERLAAVERVQEHAVSRIERYEAHLREPHD